MTSSRIISSLLLGVLVCHVTGSDWMELPFGDDSFNVQAEFNTNVTLICNDSTVPDNYDFLYWIAPDLTIMKENYNSSFRTLDGMAGWEVRSEGMELLAYLIQEAHFGFYYCVRGSSADNVYVIKTAINYKGPYWGDLWEKYETNTIIGLTASGGFLAFVILIGITWHFRYHDDVTEQDGGIEEHGNSTAGGRSEYQGTSGYTNAAFEPIKGLGFSPVSPVDVHRVTGGTTS